jgi:flagellar motility protein MotE (MotC chaperone)
VDDRAGDRFGAEWVKRREEFLKKADQSVVAIYSQMRPDAASQQIAAMNPEAAAAIPGGGANVA